MPSRDETKAGKEVAGLFVTRKPLILASRSPRRRRFFENLGLDFTICTADIEETRRLGELSEAFVLRMAVEKAVRVMDSHPASWVVAADTVVVFEDRVLGKPEGRDEAVAMLTLLSGREHSVQTGYCIGCRNENVIVSEVVTTRVQFANFSEEIARAYVATGEPLDKAGAYGIQGRGAFLVLALTGSYTNVVGMPLQEVVSGLCRLGVIAA